VKVMRAGDLGAVPVAPQWRVIERVTAGQVLLAAHRRDEAEEALRAALTTAESHRLPHQIQRTIRVADDGGLPEVSAAGRAAFRRLNDLLAPT
jgi:hypothetical protein